MDGSKVSHYRILEKIGAGGMGEVYLAEDMKLGRKVAIKILSEEYTTNKDRLHRFEQEAAAASNLNHPNILTIHEVGSDDGHHFIATEYIDGVTLRRKAAEAPLEIKEILDIAIQIAGALEEAHAAGIVHRDIKPDNVMVRRNGYVKVLDFGLAKLTETVDRSPLDPDAATRVLVQTDAGVVMGTSHYMSPEQARGKPVDARSDIWSLGVVIYEMVAGRTPFSGETSTDVIVAITQKEPPPLARFAPSVPPELDWIVNKALRKDREERYQTIKELLTDLRRLKQRLEFEQEMERSSTPGLVTKSTVSTVAAPTIQERAMTTAEKTVSHVSSAEYIATGIKRHKLVAAIVALAIVAAIGAAYYFYLHRTQPLTERDTVLLTDFVNTTGEPLFDGTLKQALAVQLGQTPFLNLFPEERVRETLRFMGRSPDDRITRDIGREICQRQGIKAMLAGSIARFGNNYVITLEAINPRSGDPFASEQVEAGHKRERAHFARHSGFEPAKETGRIAQLDPEVRRQDRTSDDFLARSAEGLRDGRRRASEGKRSRVACLLQTRRRPRSELRDGLRAHRRALLQPGADRNFQAVYSKGVRPSRSGERTRTPVHCRKVLQLRHRRIRQSR